MLTRSKQVQFKDDIPYFSPKIPFKTEKELLIEKITLSFQTAVKDKQNIKYVKASIGDRIFTCLRSHKGNPKPLVEYLCPGNEERQNSILRSLKKILSVYSSKTQP